MQTIRPTPTSRGFEQLPSLIDCLVVMAMSRIYPGLAFVGVEFLLIFGFWAIILDPSEPISLRW